MIFSNIFFFISKKNRITRFQATRLPFTLRPEAFRPHLAVGLA
jgi:hypothetical protein